MNWTWTSVPTAMLWFSPERGLGREAAAVRKAREDGVALTGQQGLLKIPARPSLRSRSTRRYPALRSCGGGWFGGVGLRLGSRPPDDGSSYTAIC